MAGDDERDTELLRKMLDDAVGYLSSFDWCASIRESFFGDGVGGIVAVFLFQIVPAKPEIDEWLWVVVGDLPPAYFVIDDLSSPRETLDAYIWHRARWVECVQSGRPVTVDIMPVNVSATAENAGILSARLETLRTEVLPFFASG